MSTELSYALYENKLTVIEAMQDGVERVDTVNAPTLGPTSYDRIDYPYVEILPASTDFEGGNEWSIASTRRAIRANQTRRRLSVDDGTDV